MTPASPSIVVTLRLFAQLRGAAGESTILREVPVGTTAGDLAHQVLEEFGLGGLADSIVLAVDAEFADPSVVLTEGAWLSLVPPVSGGAPVPGEPVAPRRTAPDAPEVSVVVTDQPLDASTALASVSDGGAGGTVLFQGTPRDVDALDFEAHHELAERELARIGADLVARHGLHGIALHHRLGRVPVGESALLVATASAHRGPAFEAARDALDEIKVRVPIWKSEVVGAESTLVDGETVQGVPTVADHLAAHTATAAAAGAPLISAPEAAQPRLTHLDDSGAARMVDVSDKAVTDRSARAVATVRVSPETAQLVASGSGPKGEVLATARLAGTMAAKRASDLVPLAHPLPLTKVDVQATVDEAAGLIHLEGFARTTGKTGVEIEALTAVLVAALVVYDMIKAVEQHAIIDDVRVVEKVGGRRDFHVDGPALAARVSPPPAEPHAEESCDSPPKALGLAAVHVSTSRTAGARPDRSRAALAAFADRTGWTVVHEVMVSDDRAAITAAIRDAAAADGVEVVFTLGGTGLTPDDVTPEATADAIDRPIPGLAEALRAVSLQITPLAALSRGTAGALGGKVVLNLPGSPKALAELEPLLSAVLPHAVSQVQRPVTP